MLLIIIYTFDNNNFVYSYKVYYITIILQRILEMSLKYYLYLVKKFYIVINFFTDNIDM